MSAAERSTAAGEPLRTTTLSTAAPSPFDFAGTVYSHGWAALDPNEWDPEREVLARTESLDSGKVVHVELSGTGSTARPRVKIDVRHRGELTQRERRAVRRDVRRMLRLDEDLASFHARCRKAGDRWAGASRGLGRLIRSPTVFEDLVKTICTTNVQWGGTRAMVRQLVHSLGEAGPLSGKGAGRPNAFPLPSRIAAAGEDELAAARLGYRAPYVRELAERVVSGDLDVEALSRDGRSTEEVRKDLLGIKGVGPYAAATMLMLLGRYDHLAIDSVYRAFVAERYFGGERPGDAEAAAVYDDWGQWKYLGYWFDLWQGAKEEL